MKKVKFVSVLLISVLTLTGCEGFVLKTVMKTVDPYFHGDEVDVLKLEKISDKVYTYQWNWYRNLILDTHEGWVVIDPMNAKMSSSLMAELEQIFPEKRVHTLIYSHYHLDHTRGGVELSPVNVIAHEKSPVYWQAVNHEGVLEPTEYISGDTVLNIGGIEIHALYLGLSHTDTLYAFHIPEERLMFTADLGLVKTVAPNGVPDRYAPGYLAAMNRLIAIDFDIFIPSHFGYGTKQDLIDWRDMMEEGRRLANDAVRKIGTPGVQQHQMGDYFDEVYITMHEKYGDWHGFDEMFVLNLVRDVVGESLGY